MPVVVAPSAPDELEDLLGDHDRIQTMLADEPDEFRRIIQGYVRNVNDRDRTVRQQVDEQVTASLAQWVKDQGAEGVVRPDLRPTASPRGQRGELHNPHALGASIDGRFDSTGDLLAALYGERIGNRSAIQRLGEIRNAFSSTVSSEGGFLVPEEFRAELMRTSLETSVVRPRARVIPMAVPRIRFPVIEDTSHVASVYGGIVGYWSEEGAQLVASSATFGAITLDAQKLTARTAIPNELLSDSVISVSAFVDQAFPRALAWFEDEAFIRGSGVGQPLGFLDAGNTASVSVAKEPGQAAATIVWENLVSMYARMLPTSLGGAVWVANQDTFRELATMALSVGTGGAPVWLTNGVTGPPMSILGRPVIFTEKTETLGTAGDINLVDLDHYLIGDRQQMTAMTSEHFNFDTDTTAYRIIQRVDGRPGFKTPITPRKGTGTLSPFVKLATRA